MLLTMMAMPAIFAPLSMKRKASQFMKLGTRHLPRSGLANRSLTCSRYACATGFDVPRFRFECPACASSDIKAIQGKELYIESFEADTGTPAAGEGSG